MVEKKAKEEREVDRKQRKEELNFFKRTNQQLKSQIEAIMTPGKQEHFHPNFNINQNQKTNLKSFIQEPKIHKLSSLT